MNSIEKLTELFSKFPGIGPRQAKRFVYYLLTRNDAYISDFTRLVENLTSEIQECTVCHRFFQKDASNSTVCDIDRSASRIEAGILMIVSRDVDLENIERTRTFAGTYFVLGGSVPILEQKPEERIRQAALAKLTKERIETGTIKEIIVAMNATPEGENTADYLIQLLTPMVSEKQITISELGKGISTGTELEYSDGETIKNALRNRA